MSCPIPSRKLEAVARKNQKQRRMGRIRRREERRKLNTEAVKKHFFDIRDYGRGVDA